MGTSGIYQRESLSKPGKGKEGLLYFPAWWLVGGRQETGEASMVAHVSRSALLGLEIGWRGTEPSRRPPLSFLSGTSGGGGCIERPLKGGRAER